ncbi:MAG: hypothetical protein IJT90_07285 [Bacteroidaceae bacterium]|nr:hypothetical protein [Bacteroidaceae bacterium]
MTKRVVKILAFGLLLICCSALRSVAGNMSSAAEQRQSRCVLTDDRQGHEALITDSSQLLRICSSRPQRLTSGEAKVKRTVQRLSALYFQHPKILAHYGWRNSCYTKAIMSMPQCDYYVLALRRLLC